MTKSFPDSLVAVARQTVPQVARNATEVVVLIDALLSRNGGAG